MTWLDEELGRVLDPNYLDDLSGLDLDEVRRMRSECEIARPQCRSSGAWLRAGWT